MAIAPEPVLIGGIIVVCMASFVALTVGVVVGVSVGRRGDSARNAMFISMASALVALVCTALLGIFLFVPVVWPVAEKIFLIFK